MAAVLILVKPQEFATRTMGPSKPQESEVRIEHTLNKKEKEFVARRRNDVLQSLKKIKITCRENEVPNIALLASGGGERAMVGLLGSLDQLQKTGFLDCVLYLSGVSGSTWCMASLYQEPDWSTKLESVKDKITQRLSGPAVSWEDAFAKLRKSYKEKDLFSLTDVWAALFVTTSVKEINERKLSDQWNQQSKDPFPIYTAIDKLGKQNKDADPWFEFTPYEAGYSLTGAFVETSSFGSKFKNGRKIKNQPEIDMLYLQALCGSALADKDEDKKVLLERIKDFLKHVPLPDQDMVEEVGKENTNSPHIDEGHKVLMELVDMNLSVLNGKDPSAHDKSLRTKLKELTGGKYQLSFHKTKLNLTDKEAVKRYMKRYTVDLFNSLSHSWPFDRLMQKLKCVDFITLMPQKNL